MCVLCCLSRPFVISYYRNTTICAESAVKHQSKIRGFDVEDHIRHGNTYGEGGVFLGGQPLLTRSAETQRSSILRFTPTYAYSL